MSQWKFDRRTTQTRAIRVALGAMLGAVLLTVLVETPRALGYSQYSTSTTTGNCATCHGGFRTNPYTSLVDGQSWANSLHNIHRNTMLNGDCDTCHSSAGEFPTAIGSSAGGTGLSPYGCSGCHGRAEDGTNPGTTQGFGAGLRQRHWRAGRTGCGDLGCHADANPTSKTPARENVPPPYYASPGTNHPAMPTDPCNPSPTYPENFVGTTLGLDNDGNGAFDGGDAACSTVVGTPGEAGVSAHLLVTGHNKATGDISVSYGTACLASGNTIEYGRLANLSTYGYEGQVCGIGNTGAASFNLPSGSFFFVVVANDGSAEGSYGTKVQGGVATERPEDSGAACPVPQNLTLRCD